MLVEKTVVVDGRYLLQERVAGGGAVELYIALDQQLQRPVAVEILSEQAARDDALCDSFHNHQVSVSSIHHPNVLQVYDAGEWEGRPYLVMERDAGQLSVGELVDPPFAIRMTRQAADALAFCRKAGLAEWPFSYKAVRAGSQGDAHLALLDDTLITEGEGPFISRRDADDPPALSALLRLLLSGSPDRKEMQPFISALPASVADVLRRMEGGAPGSFADAGEVADAIRAIEAASNDYTQANNAVAVSAGVQGSVTGVPVATPPDLQRTSSFADAPTLAVGQQSVFPPAPYVPATGNASSESTMAAPEVLAAPSISADPRPYIPSNSAPLGRRRFKPLLLLPLLGLALLVGAFFLAAQRSTSAPLVSDNLAALSTPTAAPVPATAPELLGKSLEEATATVEELGLRLSVTDPVYNGVVPPDRIASQDPAPGAQLQAGGIISVTMSLGPAPQEDDDEGESAAPPPPSGPADNQPNQKKGPGKENKGKKK